MIIRIAQTAVRRRRLVITGWIAVMVVGFVLSTGLIDRLDPLAHGDSRKEAIKGADALERVTGSSGEVVALVDDIDIADAATRQAIETAAADIRAIPGVVTAFDYYSTNNPALVATDKRATLVVAYVASALSDSRERDVVKAVEQRFEAIGDNVRIGGILAANEAFRTAAEDDLRRGESIALPIALVVMVLIFGGWRAATLPLSISIASIASSIILLLFATTFMDISVYALNVVSMLGLGLGIDYGLLIVSRFREERAAGRELHDAIDPRVNSAGRTVLFSALTVAASLLGLLVFRIDVFYAFALAGIGVVVFSMLVALTLLPALLATPLGAKIKPARPSSSDHGYFATIAAFRAAAGRSRRGLHRSWAPVTRGAVPGGEVRIWRPPRFAAVVRGAQRCVDVGRPVPRTGSGPHHGCGVGAAEFTIGGDLCRAARGPARRRQCVTPSHTVDRHDGDRRRSLG